MEEDIYSIGSISEKKNIFGSIITFLALTEVFTKSELGIYQTH